MSDPTNDALKLAERIRPLLAGHPPYVQGGALATLLSVWICGHVSPGDKEETKEIREDLLHMHFEAVRAAIEEDDE